MKTWSFYRWFCYTIAFLNLILIGIGGWFVSNADSLQNELVTADIIARVGWLAIAVGVIFACLNVGITLLPVSPWAYGVHYTNLILACCTVFLLPAALPLAIRWTKLETKTFFGISTRSENRNAGGFEI